METDLNAFDYKRVEALRRVLGDVIAQHDYTFGAGVSRDLEEESVEVELWVRPQHVEEVRRDMERAIEAFTRDHEVERSDAGTVEQ